MDITYIDEITELPWKKPCITFAINILILQLIKLNLKFKAIAFRGFTLAKTIKKCFVKFCL